MVLHEFDQPLRLEEVEAPRIGAQEVLVKIKACGVCASDIKMVRGIVPNVTLPHILGHQPAGDVLEIGPGVKGFSPGDRVCVYVFVTCGECFYCRMGQENNCIKTRRIGHELNGAYAEYLKVPSVNVFKIPDGIPYEEGSIIADAISTPFHAIHKQARVKPGEDVLIIGIGGLGIHAVQIAKAANARVIAADLTSRKLEFAKKYGADEVIDVRREVMKESVLKLTGGKRVDSVIDFVGNSETVKAGLASVRRGGKIVLVGYDPLNDFTASPMQVVLEEIEIIGSHAATSQEMHEIIELVRARKVKPVVAARYPLKEANEALRVLTSEEVLGRIVLMTEQSPGGRLL